MTTPNRPSANPNDESDSTVADLDKRVFRVETLVDIEKSLSEKIETLGRDLRKELGDRIEAQGDRIEALGKDLSKVKGTLYILIPLIVAIFAVILNIAFRGGTL